MPQPIHTNFLLDRAIALERAGHWRSAIDTCEEAYRCSIDDRNICDLIEAVRRIGYSYQWMGDDDLAQDYLDLALTLAELQSDTRGVARALNGIAILNQVHGKVEQAESIYEQARELAIAADDILTAADISQNLGTLSSIRGDLQSALSHYSMGLSLYERQAYERGIALVLNNLGMLHTNLEEFEQASICLDRALDVCQSNDDVMTEVIVHVNRTALFLQRGNLALARESCDAAFKIASRLGDNRNKAEALRLYGAIYRHAGKLKLAETHLEQAISISSENNIPLTEAEAQREMALVLRAQERNQESLETLNRAHTLFSHLQAQREQADIAKHIAQLERDFISFVRKWGESIEAKDRYTRGHCQRVAEYACLIAERSGIGDGEMVWFKMGAFLHDLGKTAVPEEILNKAGQLSDEERRIMEQHTVIGDSMLAHIPFPWDIRPMVRSHHERWDGQGYPDALVADQIPFTARILRLADIFDALTTARSYRAPMTAEEALKVMENDEGSFDPTLFVIFRDLLSEFALITESGYSSSAMVRPAVLSA
jgi:putative nucleotidyltransferase with HDIG domain